MHSISASPRRGRTIGCYVIHEEIAAGGMATVHIGHHVDRASFPYTLAIKRLYPHFSKDPEFVSMFLDEARVAGRIGHPNVIGSIDIIAERGELVLVMHYVHGETLARLLGLTPRDSDGPSPGVVASVLSDALHGLHAAHIATSAGGQPLDIVHRDVSPQNILVGADGIARVIDFGVAKAAMRSQTTSQGQLKGKLSYMSPEQLRAAPVDRRADVFAAGVVLWEALTMRRLFMSDDAADLINRVLRAPLPAPSRYNPNVPPALDRVVLCALERDPDVRFQSAREFAAAIERAIPRAPPAEVARWVNRIAGPSLTQRSELCASLEQDAFSGLTLRQPELLPAEEDEPAPTVPATPALRVHINSPSQRSTISVTTDHDEPERAPSNRAWWIAVALLAAAVGLTLALGHGRRATAPAETAAMPAPAPMPAPLTSAKPASSVQAAGAELQPIPVESLELEKPNPRRVRRTVRAKPRRVAR